MPSCRCSRLESRDDRGDASRGAAKPMFLASSGCGKIEPEGFSSEPHLVQHGRKLARHGDTSLMNARTPSDLLAPGLYRERSLETRDHDRGGLEQELTCQRIAALRDAADHLDVAGLILLRREPEIGADVRGSPEPAWIADRRREADGRDRANSGSGCQESADRVVPGESHQTAVDRLALLTNGLPQPQQAFDQRSHDRIIRHRLPHLRLKGAAPTRTHQHAEGLLAKHPRYA